VLDALAALSSPLLVDDYLELINPLWSTRELRGRVESIDHETADAATVLIKPGYRWGGHLPGQYLRIGIDIQGVRHWRAYSLTSDPERSDGLISITVKNVDEGKVSPYLVRRGRPGTIVSLGGVEGEFILPEKLPAKLLFISAGSGITPIMSMLRNLDQRDELSDAVLLHSARGSDEVIFGPELRELADRNQGFILHEQLTGEKGRMGPEDLDRLCEDWKKRETFISGPSDMLDAFIEHYEAAGLGDQLNMERFQPKLGLDGGNGEGGRIKFLESDCETESDGSNLGYQVEHHLYPDMPSTRYGEIAPKVREICERYELPYNSGPFHQQLGMVQRTILRLAFPGGRSRPKPGPYQGPLYRGKGEHGAPDLREAA